MKNRIVTPADRLIVAADPKLNTSHPYQVFQKHPDVFQKIARNYVLGLAKSLEGTGVHLKVNSALRACGYGLIGEIQDYGLKVFADLKLFDIGNTLATDGILLKEAKPEIVTTVCLVGPGGMLSLKRELPDTEVLGVTVLTNFTEDETKLLFGTTSIEVIASNLAYLGERSFIDGFICSPKEVTRLRSQISPMRTLNTPGVRPTWATVPGDDQNPDRVMTPAQAIQAGADRIVVGRPITGAENPYDAVMRTIEEITSAVSP